MPRPQNANCDVGAYERMTFSAAWFIPCCSDILITAFSAAGAAAESATEFEALMISAKDQQGTVIAGEIAAGIKAVRGELEAVGASKDPASALALLDKTSTLFAALAKQIDTARACCSAAPDAMVAQFALAKAVERLQGSVNTLTRGTRRQLALDTLDMLLQKVRGFGVAGKSLEAMLQAAQSSLLDGRDGPALNQLEAFVHHAEALAGKRLDPAVASAAAEAARSIAFLLGG